MNAHTAMNQTAWNDLLAKAASGVEVRTDSRAVQPGDVFVAIPGTVRDGGEFIPMALSRGAAFVVAQSAQAETHWPAGAGASLVLHGDPRNALGELASACFGTASLPFPVAGVTGTNGKTTVTYLLEHVINASGGRAGVVGTVEYRWPGHQEDASHTTPDCLKLHALLAAMAKDDVTGAVMEVSSHALDQDRVAGVSFDVAAITNVTQDHLDYHGDMEAYFQAKRRFFTTLLKDPAKAVINFDDAFGRRLLEEFPQALGYGLGSVGAPRRALTGRVVASSGRGLQMEMALDGQRWNLTSPMIGAFNASNLLTAQGMALSLGLPIEALQSLEGCSGAPGRLERVQNDKGLSVFVDYAHTPDALENVLQALRGLDFDRVVAVFGCGGNRDRAKRPLMAQAVARWADVAVLTSDNPRHEVPEAIMDDARPGLAGARAVIEHPDRREAVRLALGEIGPRDALLIAGKGHETYQQIGDVKHPFNDVLVVQELLA